MLFGLFETKNEKRRREFREVFANKADSIILRDAAQEMTEKEKTFEHAGRKWLIKELG